MARRSFHPGKGIILASHDTAVCKPIFTNSKPHNIQASELIINQDTKVKGKKSLTPGMAMIFFIMLPNSAEKNTKIADPRIITVTTNKSISLSSAL